MKKIILGLILFVLVSSVCVYIKGNAYSAEKNIKYGPVHFTIKVSSFLAKNRVADYKPENILDGNLDTAWIEGEKGVIGAYITFKFDKSIDFCGFEYIPGYIKNQETFKTNGIPSNYKIRTDTTEVEVYSFIKDRLIGIDEQYDPSPITETDVNDKDNYSYQYIIFKPIKTRSVTLLIDWSRHSKCEDSGFTELHPIIGIGNKIYSKNSLDKLPIKPIIDGIESAKFIDSVEIPTKNIREKPIDDTANIVSIKDVKRIDSKKLNLNEKLLFFPYGESFRVYPITCGARIESFVFFDLYECGSAFGILKREVFLLKQKNQWYFQKIALDNEAWEK